jgi:hypothetical protein
MKSSLIRVKIGDFVMYTDGRQGILKDIQLVPNGISDTSLIAILYVEMNESRGKGTMSATSDKFKVIEEFEYDEFYPTPHLIKLSENNN